MQQKLRDWLAKLPYTDRLLRHQAALFQLMLLIIIGGCLVGLPLNAATADTPSALLLPLVSFPLLIGCTLIALVQLRRGQFRFAVALTTFGSLLTISFALLGAGLAHSEGILIAFTIPVTLAGLLNGRRGLLLSGGLSIAIVLLVALLEMLAPALAGFANTPLNTPLALAATFVLLLVVLCLFIDRFGVSLRDALSTAQLRERELEGLRASLERQIGDRTASLAQALEAGEERQTQLAQALAELSASEATVRNLSAPVLPVLPGVLVAPLIGVLDPARAAIVTDNVLRMIQRERATTLIFDITGMLILDPDAAQELLRALAAVRLLGAEAILVGIRPEVAETLIALRIDLAPIRSYPSLQEAVEAWLASRAAARAAKG